MIFFLYGLLMLVRLVWGVVVGWRFVALCSLSIYLLRNGVCVIIYSPMQLMSVYHLSTIRRISYLISHIS